MTIEVKMPQLGESVTEGTISKWLVKPGDKVQKYEPIAEVITDKVNAEVPSSYSGIIKELLVNEDETVEVGKVICTIIVEGEESSQQMMTTSSNEARNPGTHINVNEKKRFSPAVLKLASEYTIDLSLVSGSGRGGRITRKDLQQIISTNSSDPVINNEQLKKADFVEVISSPETTLEITASIEVHQTVGDIEIPITGVRKAIAQNMRKSKHEAPHAWMMVEVDVTNLVKYRDSMKDLFFQKEKFPLTYLPFFIKVVVEKLKEFPQVNSMWAGDKIIQKKDIHISLAVATDDALFVPVIKDADEKTIKGIAKEIHVLSTKVRNNSITSSAMQGGTFTINNTGSFGSILSTPIINPPQAAILSVESIVKRPVVIENDAIAIRHIVHLCLSLDHRVLDGYVCGKFLAAIKQRLETISKDNTPIY